MIMAMRLHSKGSAATSQASASSSASASKESVKDTPGYKHFYLTEDAREFLKSKSSMAQALIERAKKYSICIDERVLKFFEKNTEDLSAAQVRNLWNIAYESDFPVVGNLPYTSRAFSLIAQMNEEYNHIRNKIRLLNFLLPWNAEDILLKLGKKRLSLDDYQEMMEDFQKRKVNEQERHNILSILESILPAEEGNSRIIYWILRLSKENRKKIVQKYQVIKTLLHRNKIESKEILYLFRQLPEQFFLNLSLEKVAEFLENMKKLQTLSGSDQQLYFTKKYNPNDLKKLEDQLKNEAAKAAEAEAAEGAEAEANRKRRQGRG